MAAAIADALACPVCYDHLDHPKILTCGHTFCKKCLDDLYRSRSDQQLLCPVCRQVTPLSKGGVSKLPTNITVKGLVEDLKSATKSDVQDQAEMKIKLMIEHADFVSQQKQKVKEAISACRFDVEDAHKSTIAKLTERKNGLLRICD